MTWRNISVEEERLRFIRKALSLSTAMPFEQLCEEFNISPKTGYKWFNRFLAQGEAGLKNQSRARLTQSERIPSDIENTIVAIRNDYPTWGPKKIRALMLYHHMQVPSASSIGTILKKHQLSKSRRYRRHVAMTAPLGDCMNPNEVWMYDFKGYFQTENGQICEPLTITDGFSRYLIRCVHMKRKRSIDVWEVLKDAF